MEELFNFSCWVGRYELRLPDKPDDWMTAPIPRLHLTGPAKLRRPKREALDYVVGLLAQLKMPKWQKDYPEWKAELDDWPTYPEGGLVIDQRDEEGYTYLGRPKLFEPDPQEMAALGRIVSAASKHIGMLQWGRMEWPPEIGQSEDISNWISLASSIKRVFRTARDSDRTYSRRIGDLGIFLVDAPSGGTAISVRPGDTSAAVVYHAARMVAAGTAFQTCVQCRSQFLAGGIRGKKKKRAGSKFCSDPCRWDFNNAKLAKRRRRV
jgi:hypothetical protein